MENFDMNTVIGMAFTWIVVIIIGFLVNKLINTPVESYFQTQKKPLKSNLKILFINLIYPT